MLLDSFFLVNQSKPLLLTEPGSHYLTLEPGLYTFVVRGAGGAGGETGQTKGSTGGAGGAGGKGDLTVQSVTFLEATNISVNVGAGGLTHTNGGNGGAGGIGTDNGVDGGAGGGGGLPSVITWEIDNEVYSIYANGGGGGGGGGGGNITWGDRQQYGSGGGGGGGFYRFVEATAFDTFTYDSVDGKTGGDSGSYYSRAGRPGVSGNTLDFPNITSGSGGTGGDYGGDRTSGGSGASGGGASGGGGGSNGYNANGSAGGVGGGGAGGSPDAGGGAKGNGGVYGGGSSASNAHSSPTDVTTENAHHKIDGNYGMGGATNTNGVDGCVLIYKG